MADTGYYYVNKVESLGALSKVRVARADANTVLDLTKRVNFTFRLYAPEGSSAAGKALEPTTALAELPAEWGAEAMPFVAKSTSWCGCPPARSAACTPRCMLFLCRCAPRFAHVSFLASTSVHLLRNRQARTPCPLKLRAIRLAHARHAGGFLFFFFSFLCMSYTRRWHADDH